MRHILDSEGPKQGLNNWNRINEFVPTASLNNSCDCFGEQREKRALQNLGSGSPSCPGCASTIAMLSQFTVSGSGIIFAESGILVTG